MFNPVNFNLNVMNFSFQMGKVTFSKEGILFEKLKKKIHVHLTLECLILKTCYWASIDQVCLWLSEVRVDCMTSFFGLRSLWMHCSTMLPPTGQSWYWRNTVITVLCVWCAVLVTLSVPYYKSSEPKMLRVYFASVMLTINSCKSNWPSAKRMSPENDQAASAAFFDPVVHMEGICCESNFSWLTTWVSKTCQWCTEDG